MEYISRASIVYKFIKFTNFNSYTAKKKINCLLIISTDNTTILIKLVKNQSFYNFTLATPFFAINYHFHHSFFFLNYCKDISTLEVCIL